MSAVLGAGRRRGMRARIIAVLALAAAGVAVSATAAGAHATLDSTSPRAGAVVQGRLTAVRLTFDEAVGTPAFIVVTGPQGRVDTAATRVDGAVVSAELGNSLPAGRYTVAFRVVSDDGHPVESSYTFQVKAAASPAPSASAGVAAPSQSASAAPAPAPAAAGVKAAPAEAVRGQDHSSHWFMGVAGAAMVLAGAGALVWERRHRSGDDEEQEPVTSSGGGGRS
jgi:methionine-rich copper-binding protein CopC